MDEEELSMSTYSEVDSVDLRGKQDSRPYSLFAYPAEDNFAGVKYPLSWIEKVQKGYFNKVLRFSSLIDEDRIINGLYYWMQRHSFPPILSIYPKSNQIL